MSISDQEFARIRNKVLKLEQGGTGNDNISVSSVTASAGFSGNLYGTASFAAAASGVTAYKISDADSDTILLLHYNGSNGDVNIGDSSAFYHPITNNKNSTNYVTITGSQSKFGGYSAEFDGTNFLTITGSSDVSQFDFGTTGDFTIESFIYLKAMPTHDEWDGGYAGDMVILVRGSPSSSDGFGLIIGTTKLMFHAYLDVVPIYGLHGMTTNTWYHVAVSRRSGTLRLFVDGAIIAEVTGDASNLSTGAYVYIGTETNQGAYFNGFMDELRVSKVARYTSSFTVPSSPFSGTGTFPTPVDGKLAYNQDTLFICVDAGVPTWKRIPLLNT